MNYQIRQSCLSIREANRVFFASIAMLIALAGCKKTTSIGRVDSTNATAPDKVEQPPVNQTRYAIEKGSGGFTERAAVVELIEVQRKTDSGDDTALKSLRLKQKGEGRRIDFDRDYVVRISKEDKELPDHCEVIAENPQGLKNPRFWVSRSILNGVNTFSGSRIITGYTIFRGGRALALTDEDVVIGSLADLLVALNEGSISEEKAGSYVFMPKALRRQDDIFDVEAIVGNYVVYTLDGPTRPNVTFAMARINGSKNPIKLGPVRIVGRKLFSTASGNVFNVPVVGLQEGIE